MKQVGRVLLGILIVAYATVWTVFAVVMLAVFEPPRNWIGWSVIIFNPAVLTATAILIERYRQRRMLHE